MRILKSAILQPMQSSALGHRRSFREVVVGAKEGEGSCEKLNEGHYFQIVTGSYPSLSSSRITISKLWKMQDCRNNPRIVV